MYPTGGASEGLRAAINRYGTRARLEEFTPTIHVFTGEYEGFNAYAESAGIHVVTHDRTNWRKTLNQIKPHDQFYISQPSAIDGNVWPDFEEFAETLNTKQPSAQLILDLTYVGCVAKPFNVKADFSNIPVIVFSLSKPAGAYYHRIGGYLSREPEPALFGNKWFKNMLAISIGTEIMKRHGVHELPTKYADIQRQAIERVNAALGMELTASDVFLLGTMKPRANPTDLERYLTRGSRAEALVRVCLTPLMAGIIDPKLNITVRARPHEGLEGPAQP
jgi:O-acetylhomoserine/O-acetylserine sulfhydrylase-like pyridoxal-dependent enzyme